MSEHVWMRHTETGGTARIAVGAVDHWRDMDWQECDPPSEPDLSKDPGVSTPEPVEPETKPAAVADENEELTRG
jgi:hypothetical protein